MIAMQKLSPTIGTRSRRHPTCTPFVRQFFIPGPTADVGCGSGRDAAWLNACGYPTKGFDASEGHLAEARRRHPQIHFSTAILPGLDGIAESSFANVLCETVIMHLEPEAITPAVERLLAILVPGGILYLSWRVAGGAARRGGRRAGRGAR